MTKTNDNVHVYSDEDYAVWTALTSVTTPTTLPPASPGVGFYEVGLLSSNGVTEGHSINETKIYDMAGSLIRIARNQEERPFTFECMEDNAAVAGLRYPGSSVVTTGATAEVETVTVTGTPTGGTFILSGGVGGSGTTAPIAYNAAASAVQLEVRTLPGLSAVTVSGTLSSGVTVTGPASGESMNLGEDASGLTGGTSPAVTVVNATPGVVGKNSRGVGPATSRNLRKWAIDLVDGGVHKRIVINSGEATQTGTVGYTGSGAAIYQFTLQPYKDSSGNFYTILDDDAAQTGTFA